MHDPALYRPTSSASPTQALLRRILILGAVGDGQDLYSLNGQPLARSWVRHHELNGPCRLEFDMSETPTEWAHHSPPSPSLVTN